MGDSVSERGGRSTGLGASSKLESSWTGSRSSSESANLLTIAAMEAPWSFMDGAGFTTGVGSGTGSGAGAAFLTGDGCGGSGSGLESAEDPTVVVGLSCTPVTSFKPSPSYKLAIETLGGMASLPANQSDAPMAGVKPTVGG